MDDKLASDIKKLLEANQISVFTTPSSMPAGKWNNKIEKALQNSSTIWVLLTPDALTDGLWVHHQLAYFYGYNHGKGDDQRGDNCKYLYMKWANRTGLYGRLHGVRIESFDDPVLVAETITREMNREFILRADWITEVGPQRLADVGEQPYTGKPAIGITKKAYGPGTTEVMLWLQNVINETIHHVSVLTAHPEVKVVEVDGCVAIFPSYAYPLRFKLRSREKRWEDIPEELVDDWGRRFNIIPGPGAPEGKVPLLITHETRGGRAMAAVFYYTMNHDSDGYPDIEIEPPVPVEWRQEVVSSR